METMGRFARMFGIVLRVRRSVLLLVLALVGVSAPAWAGPVLSEDVSKLGAADTAAVQKAIEHLRDSGDPKALEVLTAFEDGNLRIDAEGNAFIKGASALKPVLDSAPAAPQGKLETPAVDNTVRRALSPALAALKLTSPNKTVRLAAAQELSKRPSEEVEGTLRKALAVEKDPEVKKFVTLAVGQLDITSKDAAKRASGVKAIADSGDVSFQSDIERLTTDPDSKVRDAANSALGSIKTKVVLINTTGHVFYGISLGSVLLLASLGLAITFGLMRIINMAHGEMLMLGAYTTFSVQNFFVKNLPASKDLYLLAAIPAAFLVTFLVGVLLERTVIRFLYGRSLETLLATWGISLILIQTVRMLYGAQNVAVENPAYLSGGFTLVQGVVLTYSRLAVIFFSVAVMTFAWFVMNKTKLGLEVRAVIANREMAASVGIATRRVDMYTFGIGSGIAGLGGVALSQLGNVGPELGQGYIVDAFMVVVLGGVGKLAGTVAGAFGLGIVNKLLEPAAGAVLGKIVILGFIILFVQKRPQGIFAPKGRAAEVM
jgi:urea transport system permease protein